jgi:hypothetical protein
MEAPPPEAVSIPSMSPEELPASAPHVTYIAGQLTIDASNAMLVDVLDEIQAKTGAAIETPSGGSSERVAVHLSGLPSAVIPALLDGSTFGYVIRASLDDPEGVQEVILSRKPSSGTQPGAQTPAAMSQPIITRPFAMSAPAPMPNRAPSVNEVSDNTPDHKPAVPEQTAPAQAESAQTAAQPIAALDNSDNSEDNPDQSAQATQPALPVPTEDAHPAPPPQLSAIQNTDQQETNRQFMQDLYRSRQKLQPQQQQAQQDQQLR